MNKLVEALAQHVPAGETPPSTLRERLLAHAALPRQRYAPFFGALSTLFDLDDGALARLFERAATNESWSTTPLANVSFFHLDGGPRVAEADNGLVRLRAGTRFPPHRHLGVERVLVLEGGYRDESSSQLYRAGDAHEMLEDSRHAYVALEECDLLLAVSVLGGIEVDGLGRLPSPKR